MVSDRISVLKEVGGKSDSLTYQSQAERKHQNSDTLAPKSVFTAPIYSIQT